MKNYITTMQPIGLLERPFEDAQLVGVSPVVLENTSAARVTVLVTWSVDTEASKAKAAAQKEEAAAHQAVCERRDALRAELIRVQFEVGDAHRAVQRALNDAELPLPMKTRDLKSAHEQLKTLLDSFGSPSGKENKQGG